MDSVCGIFGFSFYSSDDRHRQSGSVPELDMHESKHFFPGQFVHSVYASFAKLYISWEAM
jgi:hypothetical protein